MCGGDLRRVISDPDVGVRRLLALILHLPPEASVRHAVREQKDKQRGPSLRDAARRGAVKVFRKG